MIVENPLPGRSRSLRLLLSFIVLCVGILATQRAEASHFRYGTISWIVPDPINNPLTVDLTVQTAWRADSIGDSDLNFGDVTNNGVVLGATVGSGVDVNGNPYVVTEYTVQHVYPAAGVYTAFIDNCCRVAGLQNGASGPFRIEATLDLNPGNTGGVISASSAIIQMQLGGTRSYLFPAFDPDGDPVACRFATSAESALPVGGTVPSVPNGGAQPTVGPVVGGCEVVWDLTNALAGQQYVIHVAIESSHLGNVSKTVVDLIVEIVTPPPPTCTITGVTGGIGSFNGANGNWAIDVGQQISVDVSGDDGVTYAINTLTMNAFNDPAGSVLLPPSPSIGIKPLATNFSWTPVVADQGTSTVVLINYTNSVNISGACTLSLFVPLCAGYGEACSAGIGECQAAGINTCVGNTTVCSAVPNQPSAELCDNLDNDCDGNVDNGNPDSGQNCSSAALGICGPGTTDCQAGGQLVCVPNIVPGSQQELCDNLDNDCDGNVDNGNPESGQSCASAAPGICTAGTTDCQAGGQLACVPNIAPGSQSELCDNLDNDCDGNVDNGNPGSGQSCASGAPGVCGPGSTDCQGGMLACVPTITPGTQQEVCGSQLDEDCDGSLNNGCADSDGDGIIDQVEIDIGSDPNDADTDDDGVPDGMEPGNACVDYAACFGDGDGDGLNSVLDPDSDNDGLRDGTEMGFDCNDPATDTSAGNCVPDGDMGATTTDPTNADTDNGGVSDGSEDSNLNGVVDAGELDPNEMSDDSAVIDSDGDGLSDDLETFIGSDPNDGDSDDDGVLDGQEPNPSSDSDGDGLINVLDPDSDNDALWDGLEMGLDCNDPDTDVTAGHCTPDGDNGTTATSPLKKDSDNGGVSDGSEDTNLNGVVDAGELDPSNPDDDVNVIDSDGDGLSDGLETTLMTDPNDADTDNDGVIDGQEPNPADDTDGDGFINALDPDSDDDGLFDGTELGLPCNNPDTDVTAGNCIPDGDGGATTTSPLDPDTDDGGVSDGDEDIDKDGVVDAGETDPNNGADDVIITDSDGDGLSDEMELQIGTDPNDADSDDDGLVDGLEINPGVDSDGDGLINALDPDSDNDGLTDGTETGHDCNNPDTNAAIGNCTPDADGGATTTDPLDADTDDGGVPDGSEDFNLNGAIDPGEGDPNDPSDDSSLVDSDGDGLSDGLELSLGTDPNDADTDNDGVIDGDEPNLSTDTDGDGLINALDPDSDNDGLFDGTELGLPCDNPDTDVSAGNCIPDGDGGATTTSPLDPDTDGGGVSDGDEDANHNGVIDAGETDPNDPSDDTNTSNTSSSSSGAGGGDPNEGLYVAGSGLFCTVPDARNDRHSGMLLLLISIAGAAAIRRRKRGTRRAA